MSPDDDPERRIQDLERSLAQSAPERTLSQSVPGEPLPTETPAAEGSRTGLKVGWVLLGLMVAAMVVSGGVILSRPSTTVGRPVAEKSTPDVAGGGGRFGSSTRETPSAPTPSAEVPSVSESPPLVPLEPPPYDTSISIAGVGRSETIDCADRPASISGVDNQVVLTGHCGLVDISGVNNSVIIDSADAIDVSGMANHVTFHSGDPELSRSGLDNTIERG